MAVGDVVDLYRYVAVGICCGMKEREVRLIV